jgi:hypothetical protein
VGKPPRAKDVRKEKREQSFKLGVLALILSLVLFWYSVNPAPQTTARRESKDNQPDDAKKRRTEPQVRNASPSLQFYRLTRRETSGAMPSSDEEPDDFDWPEFIDG